MSASREITALPDDISFEKWVEFVFDHEVRRPQWWFEPAAAEDCWWWDEESNSALAVRHVTNLFREPAILLSRYSPAQIDQGVSFLISNTCSSHLCFLYENSIPLAERVQCVESFYPLFRDVFSVICKDELGHTETDGRASSVLNYSCYMWWDIIPLWAGTEGDGVGEISQACLAVMERILGLPSQACQESALHGLGHWQLDARRKVEEIIDKYLRRGDISEELREYAIAARSGSIQ